MGEAKRRGTFEERKSQAIARREIDIYEKYPYAHFCQDTNNGVEKVVLLRRKRAITPILIAAALAGSSVTS